MATPAALTPVASSPDLRPGASSSYVLRVRGHSLREEQIRDGDFLIVSVRTEPENGDMVMAVVDGGDPVVRTYRNAPDGYVQLESASGSAAYVRPERLAITGVVLGVVRKY